MFFRPNFIEVRFKEYEKNVCKWKFMKECSFSARERVRALLRSCRARARSLAFSQALMAALYVMVFACTRLFAMPWKIYKARTQSPAFSQALMAAL